MTEIEVDLEIQRVRNLVETFGWRMTKDERVGNKVLLTLEKEIKLVEVEADETGS